MELLTPEEIVRPSPSERIALIAQLWDSLNDQDLPVTTAQESELERRLAWIKTEAKASPGPR
jgi:putative addiction module component (TIGR02574 family)